MKSRIRLSGMSVTGVVAVVFMLAMVGNIQANTLKVDFSGTKVQEGFTAQGAVDAVYDLGDGITVTVNLEDGASLADRGMSTVVPSSGSSFISDGTDINALEDDFIVFTGINNPSTFITISGALGEFRWEGWFADLADTVSVEDQGITISADGGVTWTPWIFQNACGINPTPVSLSAIANGTDDIIIQINGIFATDHQHRFNGFALEANPVPEPMTISLLVAGVAGLYATRRRK